MVLFKYTNMSETRDDSIYETLKSKHSARHGQHEARSSPPRGEPPVRRFDRTTRAMSAGLAVLTLVNPFSKSTIDSSTGNESSFKVNQGIEQVQEQKFLTIESITERINAVGQKKEPQMVTTEHPPVLTPEIMGDLIMLRKKDPDEFLRMVPYIKITPEIKKEIEHLTAQSPETYMKYEKNLKGLLVKEEYKKLLEAAFVQDPRLIAEDHYRELFDEILANDPEASPVVKKIASLSMPTTGILLEDMMNGNLNEDTADWQLNHPNIALKKLIDIKSVPDHLAAFAVEREILNIAENKVSYINNLHDQEDSERFSVVEGLPAKLIYPLIAYNDGRIYTSSFNGLFNRMMADMQTNHIDGNELLTQVGNVRRSSFVKQLVEFNRLDEFLGTMKKEDATAVLLTAVKGLEQAENPTEQGMVAADILGTISDTAQRRMLEDLIISEYKRVSEDRHTGKDARKLYGLLGAVLADNGSENPIIKQLRLEYSLPSLNQVKPADFFDANNTNVQQFYFYNDKGEERLDGHNSFKHMLNSYGFDAVWDEQGIIAKIPTTEKNGVKVVDKGSYIVLTQEVNGKKVEIWANKPSEDVKGIKDIETALDVAGKQVKVAAHRGHSTHVEKTISHIPPGVELVFLGSCGGYGNLEAVLKNQIIATKSTGTMKINDGILVKLSEALLKGDDFTWQEFWKSLPEELRTDKDFQNYISPDRNKGLAFLLAFNPMKKPSVPQPTDIPFPNVNTAGIPIAPNN